MIDILSQIFAEWYICDVFIIWLDDIDAYLLKLVCKHFHEQINQRRSFDMFNVQYIMDAAANNDNLTLMQFAYDIGCCFHMSNFHMMASKGYHKCLEYAISKRNISHARMESIAYDAASVGSLECLKLTLKCASKFDMPGICAAVGNIECLKYVREIGHKFSRTITANAAKSGSLECLKYVHELGYSMYNDTCMYAAIAGSLPCLQYAFENKCMITKKTVLCATTLECFKYAYSKYGSMPDEICRYMATDNLIDCLKFAHKNGGSLDVGAAVVAAGAGAFECLKYLYENNCPFNKKVVIAAARHGSLKCLRYLMEIGIPCNLAEVFIKIVTVGAYDCLLYIIKRYDEIKSKVVDLPIYDLAVSSKNVDCLKIVHRLGHKWDKNTCTTAARAGTLKCLMYLHENGCPWDEETCITAANVGALDCLQYAIRNNCPITSNKYYNRIWSEDIECFLFKIKIRKIPTFCQNM